MMQDLKEILIEVDVELIPTLSSTLNIDEYVEKISKNATVFPVYMNGKMEAFIALYCNDEVSNTAYLTMIAVRRAQRKKGLGRVLIETAIEYLKLMNFKKLKLEVFKTNTRALELYKSLGFFIIAENEYSLFMEKTI